MAQDRALMRSGLSGAFLLLLLSSTASGLGSVVSRRYTYITKYYTWEEAQSYCTSSSYYTDLAVFYTQSEAARVLLTERYYAWIGLHKVTGLLGDVWVWSDGGDYNFTNWGRKTTEGQECAATDYFYRKGWGQNCEDIMFFICHEKKGELEYVFVPEAKTWFEAQQYCRKNYDDLASVADSDLSTAVDMQDFPIWIGLRRAGETWSWSTGFSDFSNWKSGEPGNSSDCVSISSITKEMSTQNCSDSFPFICMSESVVLIRESKTWEEALEHCRALTSSTDHKLRFDLLSVQPDDEHDYLMSKMLEANTEEVWTGLRFLAGEWLWVNGADMLYTHLPPCPVLGHHCGALLKEDASSLEARDCMERKNFMCYSF